MALTRTNRRDYSPVPRLRPAPANLGGKKVNNKKSYVVQVGEQSITLETGQLAMQAGGAVLVRLGDSVVLCHGDSFKDAARGDQLFPLDGGL